MNFLAKIANQSQFLSNNSRVKQILMLFSVNIVTIPIGIVTSIVLTKYLGSSEYGNYQFINNLFGLVVVFFSFGFLQAGNRALVLNKSVKQAREYYGGMIIIVLFLFLLTSLVLVFYALFDKNMLQKGLSNTLLYLIPFSWVYFMVSYCEVLFQADNQMKLLAYSRLLPKVGFLISCGVIYFFFLKFNVDKLLLIWLFYLLTQVLVFVYIVFKLKASFRNCRHRLKEIWHHNLTYGIHVYLGSAFSVGIAQLTGVLISYFGHTNSGVGFFSLALTFSNPLSVIPNTIATTNYKDFSTQRSISKKLILYTSLLSLISLIFLWIIVPPFIRTFYGSQFESVINLNFVASIGVALFGFGDFFNRFIGAKGYGRLLRNSSFVVGISTLLLNIILIPKFNELGAAYTRLFGGLIYFLCMCFYYRKVLRLQSDSI